MADETSTETPATEVAIIPKSEFVLEEVPIGRGGYGTVFIGKHEQFGVVAVKTLIDNGLLTQKHIKILKKEAKTLAEICKHENILKMFGLIMERDNYSLVTEYMALGNVSEFRKDYGIHYPVLVRIIQDITRGMKYLHELKPHILHMDLKADNILINGHMRAKIADFGLSEWRTVSMTMTRSHTGGRRCTVSHVPPEIWVNINLPGNPQYDVYSFGVLLWEAYTGEIPYGKLSDELIRSAVLSGQRPDFSKLPKDCPAALSQMMTRCWHQKPQQRPLFKDLHEEISKLYEKDYEKNIIKSMKELRAKICEQCEPNEEAYIQTAHIEDLEVPVEDPPMDTSTPSTSNTPRPGGSQPTPSTSTRVTPVTPAPKPAAFKPVTAKLYSNDKDLPRDEQLFRKMLHNPAFLKLSRSADFCDMFYISYRWKDVLNDPESLDNYMASDLTHQWELQHQMHAVQTLAGSHHYRFAADRAKLYNILYKEEVEAYQTTIQKHRCDTGFHRGEQSEREKRRMRVENSLGYEFEMNYPAPFSSDTPAFRGPKIQALKKALENADQLEKALKGGSSMSLNLIEPETLKLARNQHLLFSIFFKDPSTLNYLANCHKDLLLKLITDSSTGNNRRNNRGPYMSHMRRMRHMGDIDDDEMEYEMLMKDMMLNSRMGRMDADDVMEKVRMMHMLQQMKGKKGSKNREPPSKSKKARELGPMHPMMRRDMYSGFDSDSDEDDMMMGMGRMRGRIHSPEEMMMGPSLMSKGKYNHPSMYDEMDDMRMEMPKMSGSRNMDLHRKTAAELKMEKGREIDEKTKKAGLFNAMKSMIFGKTDPDDKKMKKGKMDTKMDVDGSKIDLETDAGPISLESPKRDSFKSSKNETSAKKPPNAPPQQAVKPEKKSPSPEPAKSQPKSTQVKESSVNPGNSQAQNLPKQKQTPAVQNKVEPQPAQEKKQSPEPAKPQAQQTQEKKQSPEPSKPQPQQTQVKNLSPEPSKAQKSQNEQKPTSTSAPQSIDVDQPESSLVRTAPPGGNMGNNPSRESSKPATVSKPPEVPQVSTPKLKIPEASAVESPEKMEIDAGPGTPTEDVKTEKFPASDGTYVIHHTHSSGAKTQVKLGGNDANVMIGDGNTMTVSNNYGPERDIFRPRSRKRMSKKLDQAMKNGSIVAQKHLHIVAENITHNWKKLGRQLDLTESQVEQVEMDFGTAGVYEESYQLLLLWKRKAGKYATVGNLIKGLSQIERDDIAEKLL